MRQTVDAASGGHAVLGVSMFSSQVIPEMRQYCCSPVTTIVPGDFLALIKKGKRIGVGIENLVDLYALAVGKESGSSGPMDFVSEDTIDNLKMDFPSFATAFNDLVKKLQKIEPLQFMKNVFAYKWKKNNMSGLENGMAYEMFIENALDDSRLMIIDSSPYLIEKIYEDSRLEGRDVKLVFSDHQIARIYSANKELSRYKVSCLSDLSFRKKTQALYCTGFQSAETILCNMEQLHAAAQRCKDLSIELLISSAVVEPQNRGQSSRRNNIREELLKLFALQGALLIESGAVKGGLKKKSILFFAKGNDHNETIPFARAAMLRDYPHLVWVPNNAKELHYSRITDNSSTLIQLYAEACASENRRKRRKRVKYYISKEIYFEYIYDTLPSGSIRASVYWQGFVAPDCEDRVKEKQKCSFKVIKKTFSSEVELFVWMDGLIFDNDDLRAMVIDSILRHEIYWRQEAYKNCVDSSDNQKKHRRMPLTLRDIYILYVIGKSGAFYGKSFDRVVCDSIFRKMYPSSDPICKIVPGETTDEDVKESVDMYCSKNSLSESTVAEGLVEKLF